MSIHRENGGSGPQIIPTSSFPWVPRDLGLALFLVFVAVCGALLADRWEEDQTDPVPFDQVERERLQQVRTVREAYEEGKRAAVTAFMQQPQTLLLAHACTANGYRRQR